MELLVFVGVLVALAVASQRWGHDSRGWERGSGLLDVDYFIENELRGRRVWLDRHLIRSGVALQRRYALAPAPNGQPTG